MGHVADVTIQNGQVPADQTDFPVYIKLADLPAEFWNTVKDGGGDIRCYKSDGTTELAREPVSCDTGTSTGELHVQYSGTLSSTVNTTIQIWADGTSSDYAETATYGAQNVWDSNFVGVWHLDTVNDSTANNNDGTTGGGVTVGGATGQVGDATYFDSVDDYIDVIPGLTGHQTFEAWIKIDAFNTGNPQYIYGAFNNNNDYQGTQFNFASDGSHLRLMTYKSNVGSNYGEIIYNNAFSSGQWYHAVGTIYNNGDGTADFRMYIDGTEQATGLDEIYYPDNVKHFLGAHYKPKDPSGADFLRGDIDNVRISSNVRSTDWISTEYNNQSSPGTFYSVSAVSGATDLILSNLSCSTTIDPISAIIYRLGNPLDVSSGSSIIDAAVSVIRKVQLNNLSSSTEISNTILDVVKGLGITNIQSQTEVMVLTLFAIRQLNIIDLSSETVINNIILNVIYAIKLNDIESSTQINNLAIQAIRQIDLSDVTSLSEITNAIVQAIRQIDTNDLTSESEITSLILQVLHDLQLNDILSPVEITNIVLTTALSLNISDISANSSIDDLTIWVLRVIKTSNINSASEITNLILSISGDVRPVTINILTEIENLLISVNRLLNFQSIISNTVITNIVLDVFRAFSLAGSSRIMTILQENRTISIPKENRMVAVSQEA